MNSPLLSIDNLSVDFNADIPFRAVDDLSLTLLSGQTLALVGESGSGKSVTAQAIMGLLPKAARIAGGAIRFNDPASPSGPVDFASLDPEGEAMRRLRGKRMGIIFQEPMTSLSPLHTIGDQVGEVLRVHEGASVTEAREAAAEALSRVGFPYPKRALDTYPFELSGGLRQRAMIAMAMICKPALLIADEPTTALDVTTQAQILDLMQRLQAETGTAILLITHDLGVVASMANTMVVLYHGRVMEAGPSESLFRNPRHAYLKALMRAVPRFGMKPGERLIPIRGITPSVPSAAAVSLPTPKGPILSVKNISKSFSLRFGWFKETSGLVKAVDAVSLDVYAGKTLGLVGESGCGKTTLSKIIMRALKADQGQVIFDDGTGPQDVSGLQGKALFDYRRAVQFIFQDPYSALNPRMTVYDLLTEPLRIHGVGGSGSEGRDFRRARAKALIDMVGLDHSHLQRYPHAFSGGQRQRLGIARALALEPRVLVCDEPVSALDVSVQAQVLNILKDLQAALGLSYLFVSHNLAVVDYLADTIAVMCRGRIIEQAPKTLLFKNPTHPYTQALLAAVPEPNIDRPLNFTALRSNRFSDPALWAAPFALVEGDGGRMHEIEPEHFMRVGVAVSQEAA